MKKSPFWTYFADTLRLGFIAKPGPLQAVIKGAASGFDTVREDAVFLRAQWFPQLCEPELVPAYGVSRGITRHHTESPEQFRARVINAYAWHMLGGKQEGLPQILKFYGFDIAGIENLRRYQPSRWAEFQVGLFNPATLADQNAILAGLETLVWLINEYKPARSVLARLYTDIYNITPLVWSGGIGGQLPPQSPPARDGQSPPASLGNWSDHYYSLFSGVPASSLGPGFAGESGLILSFGLRYGVETARPGGDFGKPVFSGLSRTGFIAPYIDAPKWSEFRWSQSFPHKHSFTISELFSVDWCERVMTSGTWEGVWDARKWAAFSTWDRMLPQWEMHSRGLSRSQLVYRDPCIEPDAGQWGGLNANWSVPTAITVGRPNKWGVFRYSDSTERRVVTIQRQSASRRAFGMARPVFASGGGMTAKGVSGAQSAPLHDQSWAGAWDKRHWNNYIAYFSVKSIEE